MMDELALIEEIDAGLRHAEGGGSLPTGMHDLDNMQFMSAPDVTPWYKNKTYWAVMGVVLAAAGVAFYYAQKKSSSNEWE